MIPIRTILHPTDFSEHSDYAFQVSCSLARVCGARLIVLHVAQPPVVIYDDAGRLLPQPADFRQAAREKLAALRAREATMAIECRVAEGEASAAIVHTAEAVHADLIVMGTHGRRGLDRLVIGSVAADVLGKAPCPVLIVKLPAPPALSSGLVTPLEAVCDSGMPREDRCAVSATSPADHPRGRG
jgi:nucleotide-binding universal stress UspA family protein